VLLETPSPGQAQAPPQIAVVQERLDLAGQVAGVPGLKQQPG
jgi:hypothetical protein